MEDEIKFRPLVSKVDGNLRNNPAELKQQKNITLFRKSPSFDTKLSQTNPARVPPYSIEEGIYVLPHVVS